MSEVSILCVGILAIYLVLAYKRPAIAFTTVPIATFFLGYVVAETETPENSVFVPLVFLSTLVVIAVSGRDRQTRQWFHWGAWYLLTVIAAMLLMGVLIAGFTALGEVYILAVIFFCAVIAIFASVIFYSVTSRGRSAIHVFSTIGAVMRQNLPLPMALDCAAAGAEYGNATILQGIKRWLVKGFSLADSLRQGYPQCPPGALAMVAAGERIGQLPAALAAIETDLRARMVGPRRLRPIHPFYPVFVVAFTLLMMTGVLTFIMPAFSATVQEMFSGDLPRATSILLHATHTLKHEPNAAFVFLLLLVSVWVYLRYREARKRPERPSLFLWVGDSFAWRLPVLHWFEKTRSMVQTLGLLRMSLAAGCPVNDAIRGTLGLDVNVRFRKRLQCWLESIERGEDIAESARRCGLGTAIAWAFDSGVNAGNTPAILEMLESHHRFMYSYRLNLTRYILWPVGILLLGSMVGFVIYAIFSPMVAVINLMAVNVYP